jgi:glycosyltransferase involved in cell wall biosynthesis
VVFVSEASKREFVKLFGEQFRFLRVITLYPRRRRQTLRATPVQGVRTPFILAVGGLEHRKNYLRCIEAFVSSPLRDTHQFVICGPRGNATKVVNEAAKPYRNVQVLGQVDDEQLTWLYENADAYLSPSLLEGFGIPVIEAAECGLISITSADGAQKEALGGHGIFVDPTRTDSIRDGLVRLIEMPASDREGCIARARAHAKTLSKHRFLTAWQDLLEEERKALQTVPDQ